MNEILETPSIAIDFEAIKAAQARLEVIKEELKTEFVGIDYIIDELIDYIRIWYLMPDVLTRPVVVGLWGMTGVGKTDLVRKLVAKLNYQDRFCEIELSNSNNNGYHSWNSSVSDFFEANGINDGQPAIVLFDEIQRFNTLDPDGNPIIDVKFSDFWELLSDGKLAKRDVKENITRYMENFLFQNLERKKNNEAEMNRDPMNMQDDNSPAKVGLWQARELKKLFGLEDTIFNIAEMTEEDILELMKERQSRKKIYEAVTHCKTLIIISGNLDDAFTMSGDTSEADIDADIFSAYTQKISLVDIKQSLSRRFKPEQVARFGNIHLIYRSLTRKDFETLIEWEVEKIIKKNKSLFGVNLKIDESINELIYQNGVFPVQGVRPVFSAVTDVLEANLTKILFETLLQQQNDIAIHYNAERKRMIAEIGTSGSVVDMEIQYVGRVDKIRQANVADMVANTSVHEAGHALIYGIFFGLAPLQLKSKVASTYMGGFTFPHQIHQTKWSMLTKIKVYLAGGLAEEVVFGTEKATIGRFNDRYEASILACDYIRKYGFIPEYQTFYAEDPRISMDLKVTDKAVEDLLQSMAIETRQLLEKHKDCLIDISKALYDAGTLKADAVADIAKEYGLNFRIAPEEHLHIANYEEILNHSS